MNYEYQGVNVSGDIVTWTWGTPDPTGDHAPETVTDVVQTNDPGGESASTLAFSGNGISGQTQPLEVVVATGLTGSVDDTTLTLKAVSTLGLSGNGISGTATPSGLSLGTGLSGNASGQLQAVPVVSWDWDSNSEPVIPSAIVLATGYGWTCSHSAGTGILTVNPPLPQLKVQNHDASGSTSYVDTVKVDADLVTSSGVPGTAQITKPRVHGVTLRNLATIGGIPGNLALEQEETATVSGVQCIFQVYDGEAANALADEGLFVLVASQTDPAENGVYRTEVQSGSMRLRRVGALNVVGAVADVYSGATYAGTSWICKQSDGTTVVWEPMTAPQKTVRVYVEYGSTTPPYWVPIIEYDLSNLSESSDASYYKLTCRAGYTGADKSSYYIESEGTYRVSNNDGVVAVDPLILAQPYDLYTKARYKAEFSSDILTISFAAGEYSDEFYRVGVTLRIDRLPVAEANES